MSYILDALKKLEHEKSRKSRGAGMINISGVHFEHERPKAAAAAGWKIALAVTIAILVTFGATWLLFRPAKGRETPVQRLAAPVSPAPSAPPVKVETAPPPVATPVVPVQQAPPAAPPAPVRVTTVSPPARSSKPEKAAVQAATATGDAAAEHTLQEPRTHTKERNAQALPADQTGAAPADIKLSGIAWQEERSARRAVVNGFLMREGGVVLGARITDIYQDRVRFSQSGKTFEIPLVSSGVSAAGK